MNKLKILMNQCNENALIFNVILSKNMNTLCALFKVFLRRDYILMQIAIKMYFFPVSVAMYMTANLSI